MVRFGGKMAGQLVSLGGNGAGQFLAAAAVALLLRLFSGPGPALMPEDESPDDEKNDAADDDSPDVGKVFPVTIRWSNITCSLSDKSSKSVSGNFISPLWEFHVSFKFCLVVEKMKKKKIDRI
jgi:hypothetical protein